MDKEINKESPDTTTWLAILDALQREAKKGRLVSLTFMLREKLDPDKAVVDHFGSHELTEIACRKTVEKIADAVAATNAGLAAAIRAGMPASTGIAPT